MIDSCHFLKFPLLAAVRVFVGAAWISGCVQAADPLGLTPGVATEKVLGQIATLANFNTSTYGGVIDYSNDDLATRTYYVRLPSGYDAANPTKKYGLITYIDAGGGGFPGSYATALDAHDVIWISGTGIDNTVATTTRCGVAIMGTFRLSELYPIDPARIYTSGLSGGSRTASALGYMRNDYFRGFVGRVGSSIPGAIPGWECAGTSSSNSDADYEVGYGTSVLHPTYFRSAIMTQYGDMRRAENMAIYRWGHLNRGNTTRLVMRNGGHSDEIGDSFTDAFNFLYHPLVDVIWDRFENANLGVNVQPGKTVAGTGFTALSGTVAETTYAYNSVTHGVLKLTGTGAAVTSNDTFTWKNTLDTIIDARLRGENATTANQNQQIGLHIVPAAAPGLPADQPGLHVYWCYGATYRLELVSAAGVHKTLATWEHAATHPMSLAATDKTFWGDTDAPDYAGKTKSFRGEDVRVVLNAAGFQLTLNRFANNVTTAPGVTLQSSDGSTPYAENIPIVIQGYWSEVETALVNNLPDGAWKLALTNDALVTGQACGNALIDEIRVVGPVGLLAAPPTLAVTAPANGQRTLTWTQIYGATGYLIQRSTSPDTGFTPLGTVSNALSTYTDATASSANAYYYLVSALGTDGTTPGNASPQAYAARSGTVPATPTTPAVTYPANYQVRVAWTDAASTETGYRIERSLAGTAQWAIVATGLAANSISYTDTTPRAGASYDYRISAYNAAGISSYASITAHVPDAAPPAPTGLAASSDYGRVSLGWDAVAQAASYRVKRATVAGGPYSIIASGLSSPAYDDTDVISGTAYFYVVTAVSGSGLLESAASGEITASPLLLPSPSGLGGNASYQLANLSWSPVPEATGGYRLQRATVPDGPYATVADNLAGTSHTDTGLDPGTTYYYVIRSLRDGVVSAASAPFTITTLAYQNVPVLDSSLKLHLDATIPESLVRDSAGNVSRWNDVDGGSNHALQPTPAAQPVWQTDPAFGKPVVDFGPYSESSATPSRWMQFKDASGADLYLSTIRTVFAVMKGSNFLLGDAGSFHFHRAGSAMTSPLWDGGFSSANIRNGQTFLNGGVAAINGTSTAMPSSYWLASVVTAGNVTASRLANDRGFRTGGQQIAEILIYDRALSDDERISVEAYLLSKWFSQLGGWRKQYFGTTANAGNAADTFDADFDGLQNLVEYALGTIPTSAASGAPPVLATDSNHLRLTFNRIADPVLIYQVEAGSDLTSASWSTIWQSTGAQNTAGPITVTDATHDIGLSNPLRRFLRLRVISY